MLRGMWDLPRPGLEPVSPALAGRLSTTAPPGKPRVYIFYTTAEYMIYFLNNRFLTWLPAWSVIGMLILIQLYG